MEWKSLLTRVWPILEKYRLVKHTRTIGRAQMYIANMDSPIMKTLHQLQIEIATFDNEKISEAQKEPILA